ncbi:hypothetical protein [Ottowia testudinis]|uniref:Uncharacterized protein n=1 Tax=Ottowia testudinis TaxID=2816950 RepID=A0A975CH35_9BURK|nr:hypothetical protein [Ottowia testudinis]QTD45459.1 hypothetical protein J1M35_00585 [Ottowia testudinis]
MLPQPLASRARTLLAACSLALPLMAQAGRPLMVDDAGVNEAGAGHIESWFERGPGGQRAWTVAPVYAPVAGLELGAAFARDTTERRNSLRLQAKLQFTAPADDRCYHAAVLGLAHTQGRGNTPGINLVMSCPFAPGTVHFNLGAAKPAHQPSAVFVGAAWEQELGWATGHVEWIATQRDKPIFNLGLRREIAKGLQLDGSLGRQAGRTLFSVGLKQQF